MALSLKLMIIAPNIEKCSHDLFLYMLFFERAEFRDVMGTSGTCSMRSPAIFQLPDSREIEFSTP